MAEAAERPPAGAPTSEEALPSLAELGRTLGPGASEGKQRRWWILGGVVLVCLAAGALAFQARRSRRLIQYESVQVTRGDLAVTVESTGTLEAVTSMEVGSEVSGRILRELVDVNDQVHKGQILAEIDPEPLNTGLEQSQAQLRGARDAIRLAQVTADESARTLARTRKLGKEGILSQFDLDAALSTTSRDQASLRSAQENAAALVSTQNDSQVIGGFGGLDGITPPPGSAASIPKPKSPYHRMVPGNRTRGSENRIIRLMAPRHHSGGAGRSWACLCPA